jgi:ABC-2 type transport system permease protein
MPSRSMTLHSEWTKTRSMSSTAWSMLAAIGLTVLLSAVVTASVDTAGGRPNCTTCDEDVVLNSLSGVYLGQIAVVCLGVLVVTSEYATGMIRTSFVATPRRIRVLLAKVSVLGTLVFVIGLIGSLAAFAVGQPLLHGNGFVYENGYPAASLLDEPVLRAVVGTALYLVALALLSLAAGAILRHTAPAISAVLALLYVPFIVALMLPEGPREVVQKYAPMTAGLSIQRTVDRYDSVPIGVWTGLGVIWAYAVVTMLLAGWLTQSRDA